MKKWLTYVSLGAILFFSVFGALTLAGMERSYEGQAAPVPVYDLQQNLARTHAVNDVTSIVFDFRGYDTMGEAFILVTAVTGSAVILFKKKAGKEDDRDE
jgi:multicomponent Na+:H+ antiporter subunit B